MSDGQVIFPLKFTVSIVITLLFVHKKDYPSTITVTTLLVQLVLWQPTLYVDMFGVIFAFTVDPMHLLLNPKMLPYDVL
jgi:hypothetical protein